MPTRRLLAAALLAAALGAAGQAHAQAPPVTLTADATQTGWIGVHVEGAPGTPVVLAENGQTLRRVTLGPAGTAAVPHLAVWGCSTNPRTIVAIVGGVPAAASAVTTPSCAGRFALQVPPAVRAGSPAAVRVTDAWRVGNLPVLVCLRERGRDVQCVSARPGAHSRIVRLTPVHTGTATVTVRSPSTPTLRAAMRVRPRERRLRVLAAGDSMMQVLDAAIGDRLPHANVRSDTHVSTGLTKPALLDWPAQARRLARAQHPDATVVFLGANDGFALPTPGGLTPCCSEAWVQAYAARARTMMAAYARGGAGRVYWLTLPAPREAAFAQIFTAVNQALRSAAGSYSATVRIVDLVPAISPGGRFRQALRQADGVHLTPAGDRVAASLVVAAMRRDGLR